MRGRANQLNQPAQVVKGGFADTRQFIRVLGQGVQIDAVKKGEKSRETGQSWSLGFLKSDPLFFSPQYVFGGSKCLFYPIY